MWIVRFVLLGLLAVYVGFSGYLLKHRDRYGRLLENGPVNLVLVLLYNLLCYLMIGLPADRSALSPSAFLTHTPSHLTDACLAITHEELGAFAWGKKVFYRVAVKQAYPIGQD